MHEGWKLLPLWEVFQEKASSFRWRNSWAVSWDPAKWRSAKIKLRKPQMTSKKRMFIFPNLQWLCYTWLRHKELSSDEHCKKRKWLFYQLEREGNLGNSFLFILLRRSFIFWPGSKKTKGHLKPALFPAAFSSADTKLANLLLWLTAADQVFPQPLSQCETLRSKWWCVHLL